MNSDDYEPFKILLDEFAELPGVSTFLVINGYGNYSLPREQEKKNRDTQALSKEREKWLEHLGKARWASAFVSVDIAEMELRRNELRAAFVKSAQLSVTSRQLPRRIGEICDEYRRAFASEVNEAKTLENEIVRMEINAENLKNHIKSLEMIPEANSIASGISSLGSVPFAAGALVVETAGAAIVAGVGFGFLAVLALGTGIYSRVLFSRRTSLQQQLSCLLEELQAKRKLLSNLRFERSREARKARARRWISLARFLREEVGTMPEWMQAD